MRPDQANSVCVLCIIAVCVLPGQRSTGLQTRSETVRNELHPRHRESTNRQVRLSQTGVVVADMCGCRRQVRLSQTGVIVTDRCNCHRQV